jgi:CheY-like chemotaxis protein
MPQGGTLEIATERRALGEGEVGDLPAGDYVALVVSDSGTGMSDSVRCRIFEPFFTTKEKGRGTGLGLAVVHGIIQRHGGRILVETHLGVGSRFTIFLPVVREEVGRRAATGALESGKLLRGTGSVLVVDDDPMVREVTGAMLEALGYRVAMVGSAAEALDAVRAATPDLVVSDIVMPEVNGLELQRLLRVERPDLKVLLVSGYAKDAFERQGIDESAAPALLKKPLTLESLGSKVRELLRA